ncbi:MAG: alpha/beta hydrolase [Balneolia bacterium]|nr:alpha/beta hydrolase [Balneolia bacterium]
MTVNGITTCRGFPRLPHLFLWSIVLLIPGGLLNAQSGEPEAALESAFAPHSWEEDVLGEGFEQITIQQPDDYEGEVFITLVRSLPEGSLANGRAVLYVHGYNDYFFQTEMARRFTDRGYAFYAVDLRKYGRSWREHQIMTNVRDLSEYYADIDTSLAIIREEGFVWTLLAGHSTGGLVTALYADSNPDSPAFDALFLNSPFFEFNSGFFTRSIAIPFIAWRGKSNHGGTVGSEEISLYGKSLHSSGRGEWDFNPEWKTLDSQPVSYGWIRAIREGHQRVARGLEITVPVLVMHSDKTISSSEWSDDFFTGDAVLNVDHIRERAQKIEAPRLDIMEIEDGMHDLVLSREPVREKVYAEWFSWLDKISGNR